MGYNGPSWTFLRTHVLQHEWHGENGYADDGVGQVEDAHYPGHHCAWLAPHKEHCGFVAIQLYLYGKSHASKVF